MPVYVRLQAAGLTGDGAQLACPAPEHTRLCGYLCADHSEGFTLRGVDFARHDAAAWLILWQAQLSQTAARPTAKEADVIRHLPTSTAPMVLAFQGRGSACAHTSCACEKAARLCSAV